jgi:beta-1,2-mannobiose phosphorylase / 1,2-beta-oligomannan phosphorylase
MVSDPGKSSFGKSDVDDRKSLVSDVNTQNHPFAQFKKSLLKSIKNVCQVLFFLAPANVQADEEFPPELTQFVPSERNPLFTAAGPGHWDVKIRERGWIIREGDQWKMWYTGYDGNTASPKMLGYATSSDRFVWQRHPKNPIHSEHWVEDVCIVPHDGLYYMFAEGVEDLAHLLTSRDGITWDSKGRLDVRLTSGEPIPDGPFGTPAVWFENGQWNLFYERRDLAIWLARSSDAKVFTNVQDEPVIELGPGKYDDYQIAINQIIRHKGRYYAVYHGSGKPADPKQPSVWSTSLATSDDLIHWKKYPGNPLRPISENKSSGLLIHDGDRFRLYTMHNEVHVHLPRAVKTP